MSRVPAARIAAKPHRPGATVSVVIPCFNYAKYLPSAVRSALDQEDVVVDVVIVDDASTDDSVVVAEDLRAHDPRIRVLVNGRNSGAVETFNRGLAAATGEFVVRLDADDLLTPGSLRRAVAVMQAFPEVGLVYGHPIHFTGEPLPRPRTVPTGWIVWSGRDWLRARCADATNVITSPEVLMRRSVVESVGGQKPLAHTHDMEMWLRLATRSDVAYITGADQAWHREHDGSLSTFAAEPLVILRDIERAFDALLGPSAASLPQVRGLQSLAHRAVATQAMDQAARVLDRGRRDDVAQLLEFAATCSPEQAASRRWHRLRSRQDTHLHPLLARARGIVPRIRRRVRDRRKQARWIRTGVYEPLRLRREKRGEAPVNDSFPLPSRTTGAPS